jgi:hypothetical protein
MVRLRDGPRGDDVTAAALSAWNEDCPQPKLMYIVMWAVSQVNLGPERSGLAQILRSHEVFVKTKKYWGITSLKKCWNNFI